MNPQAAATLVIQNPAEPETRMEMEFESIAEAVNLGLGFIQALHEEGMMNIDMPGVHVAQQGAPIASLASGLHPLWAPKVKENGVVVKDESVKPLRPSCMGLKSLRPDAKAGEQLVEEAPSWIHSWSDLI